MICEGGVKHVRFPEDEINVCVGRGGGVGGCERKREKERRREMYHEF